MPSMSSPKRLSVYVLSLLLMPIPMKRAKKHRNITDTELSELGVIREWNESNARTLQPETKLLWVHNRRKKYTSIDQNDNRLIRTVTIIKIDDYDITTDFGKYSLETGRNVHGACGCMRFCDCYGRLYLSQKQMNESI